MELAPIIVFTFNRLSHTKNTIESLKKNILADESELFIFSDGARNIEEEKKVSEVRKYLKQVDGFKSIRIIESKENKGLANSVINGVTEIINKYGKVIVLEDDLITSKYFLKYMNESLNLYKDREDIWSVSGYIHNMKISHNYKDEIFLIKRASSWGWGTWKNRWILNDWNVNDYKQLKKDKLKRDRLNEGGEDLFFMLQDQMEGRIDSWAIRWVYNQINQNKWTIYPIKSLVKNIGTDLSGTHSSNTSKYDVEIVNKEIILNKNVKIDEFMCNSFREIHQLKPNEYLAIFVKKIGLYKPARKIRNLLIKYL